MHLFPGTKHNVYNLSWAASMKAIELITDASSEDFQDTCDDVSVFHFAKGPRDTIGVPPMELCYVQTDTCSSVIKKLCLSIIWTPGG